MVKDYIKPLSLIASLVLGFVFSEYFFYLAKYAAPFLFLMLFLPMLKIDKFLQVNYIKPMLIIMLIPLIFGGVLYLALSVLMSNNHIILISSALIILSPIATTAVVMIRAIKGNISFTVMAIMLSHFVIIALWPIFTFFSEIDIDFVEIILKLSFMVLVPFFLSRILRKTSVGVYIARFEALGFYLWIFIVFTNIASISHTFKTGVLQTHQLISMFCVSLGLFVLNYVVGLLVLQQSRFKKEIVQLFVQRNTVFGIWLANTFFNPIYTICPIFYLIFQNVYNTGRLIAHNRYDKTKTKTK